jgi:outer membrane protein assembly factor BamE (lipoprotein component of BamABCDE complex)
MLAGCLTRGARCFPTMMFAMSRFRSVCTYAALLGALCLAACDDQSGGAAAVAASEPSMSGFKDFLNAIKPAPLLLKGLEPGISTETDVRERMGRPETERVFTDGSKRLEYPRGPMGDETYMVDLDSDGLFVGATQVLTADNFAKVQPGMTMDAVRRLLGKPTEIAQYPLKPETVWSWRWREGGFNQDAFFNAHFGPDGMVYRTSRSDILKGH